jgi:hypothetical protein
MHNGDNALFGMYRMYYVVCWVDTFFLKVCIRLGECYLFIYME